MSNQSIDHIPEEHFRDILDWVILDRYFFQETSQVVIHLQHHLKVRVPNIVLIVDKVLVLVKVVLL